jgi:hypothetical protein
MLLCFYFVENDGIYFREACNVINAPIHPVDTYSYGVLGVIGSLIITFSYGDYSCSNKLFNVLETCLDCRRGKQLELGREIKRKRSIENGLY